MFNKLPFHDKKVVTIISGGNVDLNKVPDYIVDAQRDRDELEPNHNIMVFLK